MVPTPFLALEKASDLQNPSWDELLPQRPQSLPSLFQTLQGPLLHRRAWSRRYHHFFHVFLCDGVVIY